MSPRAVVLAALSKGLGLIGVCDHNSAENVLAAKNAGRERGLAVLGGMEVSSAEEAHLLVFFDHDDDLLRFQDVVYGHLSGTNDEKRFGQQVIADEDDGVTGFCDRLLIAATSLPVEGIVAAARASAGESLIIAAHIDRDMFSLVGQLGFIPPHLGLDAVEVSRRVTVDEARGRFAECGTYPVVTASDAHHPDDIGSSTMCLTIENASVAEIKKALQGRDGRKAVC
jgi:PHP family Zn ribbon phosphoesterase